MNMEERGEKLTLMRNRVKVQKGRVLKGSINLPTNFTMTLLRVARIQSEEVQIRNLRFKLLSILRFSNTSGWFIKNSVCYVACFCWYKYFLKFKISVKIMCGQENRTKDFRLE